MVVGTPGRLRDLLNRGCLRLDKLRVLVLDEADEMMDRGFAPDLEAIAEAANTSVDRQTALFSATLPEWVRSAVSNHLRSDHESILLKQTSENQPDIEHLVYDMKIADKHTALFSLLDNNPEESILVFARTRHGVDKLATRLQSEGYAAAGLQGDLSQRERDRVMTDFRFKRVRVMVATNVGARGLDVKGISHVVNFDLPESPELFTHRAGRTGRNGARGTAITFLTGEDRMKWREIEAAMKKAGISLNRKRWESAHSTSEVIPSIIQEPLRTHTAFESSPAGQTGFNQKYRKNFAPQKNSAPNGQSRQDTFNRSGDKPNRNARFGNNKTHDVSERTAWYNRFEDGKTSAKPGRRDKGQ